MKIIKDIIVDNYEMIIVMCCYFMLGIGVGAAVTDLINHMNPNRRGRRKKKCDLKTQKSSDSKRHSEE